MANPTPASTDTKPTPEKRWRWLINNEARGRILVLKGVTAEISKTHSPGSQIGLIPGANLVDARRLKKWRAENADRTVDGEVIAGQDTQLFKEPIPRDRHPSRRAERAGQPPLVEGPAVASAGAPLADLTDDQAREIVREILDPTVLERLAGTERRAIVAEAISAQLRTISVGVAAAGGLAALG